MKRYLRGFVFSRVTAGLAGGIALGAVAVSATQAYTGQEFAAKAKITYLQAQAIALKAQPGTVTAGELEPEAGGERTSLFLRHPDRHWRDPRGGR